ncbi:ABC transporter ATP-binding protein [Pyrococcus furiosus DSM 3638]|uniref:ABC transporter ATP-binding protein n=3 Tax=Pyrococcus furiosus TaxID=2261 RepID=A0A5C0XS54_PYRFU|nr:MULTISPECIES: ABC transporter ATP-binding protein [Pyrococcus]AAL81135.1 daunorubicin resistance ATP-binding protein drrA [Pyrococcus furiosus DSM 3638]AFN03806.1 daunorubicin resistance ATP-binding protein drrA [Pyrococcus furiosus COM1]MDK2870052.1 type transport system ATP-binding protein [Pyrococcus sp.]QEK78674.1 ABC transporter ATP-binding protein [Pyrococcus furiosus DSM 3638]
MIIALEIKGLKKRYGNVEALKGITLEVYEGEIFALLGPNGAGKTTLIRILAEGLKYDEGEIKVFGRTLSRETRRLIGYVPQESIAYDLLTVKENLEFYADIYNAPRERIKELIELFSLPEKKKAKELSGGFKRRLNLAIALLYDPKILILDEPTTGLDVPSRRDFWEIIRGFKKDGKTVLLATHYMEEAEELADRVAIMNEGKVISIGTPEELKRLIGEESIITIKGLLKGLEEISYPFIEKDNEIRVRVRNPREALPKIVENLIKAGSIIKEIRVEEPTLEDVFIKLTGRRLE